VNQYRVTKYNPAFRDSSGAYRRDQWISFGDIGRSFDGVKLTPEAYDRVEDAYVAAAVAFLRESAVPHLAVRALENKQGQAVPISEGDALPIEQLGDVLRSVLREEFWCRFEANDAFVHVGWDYCMYVGVPRPCYAARRMAEKLGLYVEDFASPYRGEKAAE
jgi:hypothetical protein